MKVKKIITLITTFMLSAILLTGNVTALGISDSLSSLSTNRVSSVNVSLKVPALSVGNGAKAQVAAARGAFYLGDVGFEDSNTVSWRDTGPYGGTTTYRDTLSTRVSELYLASTTGQALVWYQNHKYRYTTNSTWTIALFPVDTDTAFMWTESGNYPDFWSNQVEPITGRLTPRRTDYLDAGNMGWAVMAVSNSGEFQFLDFYSPLNPIVHRVMPSFALMPQP